MQLAGIINANFAPNHFRVLGDPGSGWGCFGVLGDPGSGWGVSPHAQQAQDSSLGRDLWAVLSRNPGPDQPDRINPTRASSDAIASSNSLACSSDASSFKFSTVPAELTTPTLTVLGAYR
jgi:hypothetical protein